MGLWKRLGEWEKKFDEKLAPTGDKVAEKLKTLGPIREFKRGWDEKTKEIADKAAKKEEVQ